MESVEIHPAKPKKERRSKWGRPIAMRSSTRRLRSAPVFHSSKTKFSSSSELASFAAGQNASSLGCWVLGSMVEPRGRCERTVRGGSSGMPRILIEMSANFLMVRLVRNRPIWRIVVVLYPASEFEAGFQHRRYSDGGKLVVSYLFLPASAGHKGILLSFGSDGIQPNHVPVGLVTGTQCPGSQPLTWRFF